MTDVADIITAAPAAPKQRLVELRGAVSILQGCNARRVLIEGRAGTGKTAGILHKIHSWCSKYPRLRAAFIRETCSSLRSTILKTFEELVVPEGHPILRGPSREHRMSYNYPGTRAHIGLFGLDDPQNLFSSEWDIIYAAEATQMRSEDIELLSRSLRNFKGPYHQLILDCNPDAPGHWLNKLATKAGNELRDAETREQYDGVQAWNDREIDLDSHELHRLISVHQDNPAYFNLDAWDWTEEGKLYLQGLGDMTGHRRQRMLKGRWTGAEGQVFPEFNEERHVVEPFNIPMSWPCYVGYDPGYHHPTAILWFLVAPDESIFIVDEIYKSGCSVQEHARAILEKNKGRNVRLHYGDPQHMFSRTAQSPRTIADQLRECGLSFSPWPRTGGQEEAMVENVRRRLVTIRRRGEPALQVFATCVNTIAEFQSWSYKRTPNGDLPPGPDKFEDKDNHTMDVVKGVLAVNPMYDYGSAGIVELTRNRWGAGDEDDDIGTSFGYLRRHRPLV
jgi:PBSX family phage terminase large subunit